MSIPSPGSSSSRKISEIKIPPTSQDIKISADKKTVLKEEIIEFFNDKDADFKDIADEIWIKLSQANENLDNQVATFITNNWDKFEAIRQGKTWEKLKEQLQDKMDQPIDLYPENSLKQKETPSSTVSVFLKTVQDFGNQALETIGLSKAENISEKPNNSWETFRNNFVLFVQDLGNQALTTMSLPTITGKAFGTSGWKSDIDWEIIPDPRMSETEHMLAKLLLDAIAIHVLGRTAETLSARTHGKVFDLSFYSQHYAAVHSTFEKLTFDETKNKFYLQELTMAMLQQIRAHPDNWKAYTSNFLKHLKTESSFRNVIQHIFEEVESFEIQLEKETRKQMLIEEALASESTSLRPKEDLKSELASLGLEDLKNLSHHISKNSEIYISAQNTITAKGLLHLSQMIDIDLQKTNEITSKIAKLTESKGTEEQITAMEKEYQEKILETSIKLAIRTSFFTEAIYTQTGYDFTVSGPEGQKAQREAEERLRRKSSGLDSPAPSLQMERRKSSANPNLQLIASLENDAQRKLSIQHLFEKKTNQQQSDLEQEGEVDSSKYSTRQIRALSIAIEQPDLDKDLQHLQFTSRELEKCKRKKKLSQLAFTELLQKALHRLNPKDKDNNNIAKEAAKLFEQGGALDETNFNLPLTATEKFDLLVDFLKEKGVPKSFLSKNIFNEEIDLILKSKVGLADLKNDKTQELFQEAKQITLEKLNLDTIQRISQHHKELENITFLALENTLEKIDFSNIAVPSLLEIWEQAQAQNS